MVFLFFCLFPHKISKSKENITNKVILAERRTFGPLSREVLLCTLSCERRAYIRRKNARFAGYRRKIGIR